VSVCVAVGCTVNGKVRCCMCSCVFVCVAVCVAVCVEVCEWQGALQYVAVISFFENSIS